MLSKQLEAVTNQRPLNNPCGIALILAQVAEKHNAQEAQKVAAILLDATRPATVLTQVLKDNGYHTNPATIRRHRKKQCSCH